MLATEPGLVNVVFQLLLSSARWCKLMMPVNWRQRREDYSVGFKANLDYIIKCYLRKEDEEEGVERESGKEERGREMGERQKLLGHFLFSSRNFLFAPWHQCFQK